MGRCGKRRKVLKRRGGKMVASARAKRLVAESAIETVVRQEVVEYQAVSLSDAPAASKEPYETSAAVRKAMKSNKRRDTKPELLMRQRLRQAGLTGYRIDWKAPGHPDIAWPGKKVAIFVHGCFWHRCPYCNLSLPKNNVKYWTVKFDRNVARDKRDLARLEEDGWKVHVVWECQLKKKAIDATLSELFPVLSEELGKPLR